MNTTHWQAVEAFDLDMPLAEYSFSTRLAYENAWPIHFTQGAIAEYKKFMFLAATADVMVSPSAIVDIVWHQHLIFTQSYDRFCTLLGKKIEHIPSTHAASSQEKFKRAKEQTVVLYEAYFGTQPALYWDCNNLTEALAIPPPTHSLKRITLAGIIAFFLLTIPAYYLLRPVYIEINNPYFLVGYAAVIVIAFIFLKRYNAKSEDLYLWDLQQHPIIGTLTATELIYFKTGSTTAVIEGLVNHLLETDVLGIVSENELVVQKEGAGTSAMEKAIIDTMINSGPLSYPDLLVQLKTKPVFTQVSNSMNSISVALRKSAYLSQLFLVNYSTLLLLFLMGYVRLITGYERGKPIFFILILMGILLFAFIGFLGKLLRGATAGIIPRLYRDKIVPDMEGSVSYDNWGWQYFLLGGAILSSSFIPLLPHDGTGFRNPDSSTGSCGSSCGSSDGGGSSCGSSCGGCGGGD